MRLYDCFEHDLIRARVVTVGKIETLEERCSRSHVLTTSTHRRHSSTTSLSQSSVCTDVKRLELFLVSASLPSRWIPGWLDRCREASLRMIRQR